MTQKNTTNKKSKHVYFFDYNEAETSHPEFARYATAQAFYKYLHLSSLEKAAEIMDNLRQRFEKHDDDVLTQDGLPVSLNFKNEIDNPLPTSPEFMVHGTNNHYVKAIRYDIFELVYSHELMHPEGNDLAPIPDADKFLQQLKSNNYKISKNIDVASAVLPIIERLKRENQELQESLDKLEQSVVVRKNESYWPDSYKSQQPGISVFNIKTRYEPYIINQKEYQQFKRLQNQQGKDND